MPFLQGLLSSFKLVSECQTHPKVQIRMSALIGFAVIRILGSYGLENHKPKSVDKDYECNANMIP